MSSPPLDAEQRRRVLALWALFAVLSAGLSINDGVANALFLARVGAKDLPLIFLLKAGLDIVGATIYVRVDRALGARTTLALLAGGVAVGSAACWLAGRGATGALYCFVLLAFAEVSQTLLKIHWGVYLLEHFDAAAAPRALPLVYTGARAGALGGGLLLGPLAAPLGPTTLLLVAAAAFAVAAIVAVARGEASYAHERSASTAGDAERGGDDDEPATPSKTDTGVFAALSRGRAAALLREPLLRALAIGTPIMVLCRYALRYRYSDIFAARLGEVGLARVYGLYIAAANAVTVMLQVFVVSRVLALPSGVAATNTIYALLVLVAFGVLWRGPALFAGALARLADAELKVALKTPLSNLFYGAIEANQRGAARALVLGLIVPLATVAVSLLLKRPSWIAYWGLPAAVALLVACTLQNRAYAAAMREANQQMDR